MSFILAVAGSFVAGLVLLGLLAAVSTPILQRLGERFLGRMIRDRYTANVFSLVNAVRRLGPQTLGEIMLRAGSGGQVIQRPLGSPCHPSPWQDLMFTPAQIVHAPLRSDAKVDLSVVVGPRAKRPLKVETPLLVAGMSFGGALAQDLKIALARAANAAGTATNTGEGFLPAERREAQRLIVQYHRGTWPMSTQHHTQFLASADAIEIQIGQGAQAAAPMRTPANLIRADQRRLFGIAPGRDAVIESRLEDVHGAQGLRRLVERLREAHGVPVGLKMAATDRLEEELDRLEDVPLDFLCLDGAEGGTHGGPPILQDDFGLPTLHAIARADRHLREAGRRRDLTLIASGGLHTPGTCLKAMALGADACYLGTSVVVASIAQQAARVAPWEPPYSMIFAAGGLRRAFSTRSAEQRIADFLRSSTAELAVGLQALGKSRLRDLSRQDMIALTRQTAALTGCRQPLAPDVESDVEAPIFPPPFEHEAPRTSPLH